MLEGGLMLLAAALWGDVRRLEWLGGAWTERRADGGWTEEYWTPPRGGLMLGAGLDGKGGKVRHLQQMRIETVEGGQIVLVAMPGGGAAVRFALVKQTADLVVFENAAHDYPQRVSYRRAGRTVVASTARIDGSREMRWTYVRP